MGKLCCVLLRIGRILFGLRSRHDISKLTVLKWRNSLEQGCHLILWRSGVWINCLVFLGWSYLLSARSLCYCVWFTGQMFCCWWCLLQVPQSQQPLPKTFPHCLRHTRWCQKAFFDARFHSFLMLRFSHILCCVLFYLPLDASQNVFSLPFCVEFEL